MIRLATIVLLLLAPWFPAQSQTAEISDMLRSIHLDPAFRESLRERGYRDEKFEVMIDHTRKLYADAGIIAGLQRKIETGLRITGNRANAAFFQQLDHAMTEAYSVGLTRLSGSERRRVIAVDYGYINTLPVRDCTRLLTGRLRPERGETLFDAYMVQLDARRIADYYALARKATRLGLAAGAVPRTLNATDTRRAEEAIFPLIDQMIGKQKNAKALYKAWSSGPERSQRYICAFTKMFGAAALKLPGRTGELAVLYIVNL